MLYDAVIRISFGGLSSKGAFKVTASLKRPLCRCVYSTRATFLQTFRLLAPLNSLELTLRQPTQLLSTTATEAFKYPKTSPNHGFQSAPAVARSVLSEWESYLWPILEMNHIELNYITT